MGEIRTADVVHHIPSDEEWVVAWADPETGYMAPCGWPTCQARIEDCRLTKAATDAECVELIDRISQSGRTDAHRARQIFAAAKDAGREALARSKPTKEGE